MKRRRRIDFYYPLTEVYFHGRIVDVLKETNDYFVINVPTLPPDFDRIRTCFLTGESVAGITEQVYKSSLRWEPHEYSQEARRACLISYWIFKKRLGKDPAGIIAKFLWSTRFEEVWETNHFLFCK